MVSARGKLYVAGGEDAIMGGINEVECFDPTTRVWTTIAPLNENRAKFELAVLGDKLYAIGGVFSSSVEYLDLSIPNGQWTLVASMTRCRYDFGTVVSGGYILSLIHI